MKSIMPVGMKAVMAVAIAMERPVAIAIVVGRDWCRRRNCETHA